MDKETRPYPSQAYSWYVVCVLLAAYILAFVDREIIAQLVPGIKASLHISDTQMSLLLGAAFAIFYTFFGVLIASFADRGNRRNLLFGFLTYVALQFAGQHVRIVVQFANFFGRRRWHLVKFRV